MTPDQISGDSNPGTVIFSARFGRRSPRRNVAILADAHHAKHLRFWLVLFMLFLAFVVPPTLAAFTAIFALWLFALSLALALIIMADLTRRSIRWARWPVPI